MTHKILNNYISVGLIHVSSSFNVVKTDYYDKKYTFVFKKLLEIWSRKLLTFLGVTVSQNSDY